MRKNIHQFSPYSFIRSQSKDQNPEEKIKTERERWEKGNEVVSLLS
jgi:hypothetical protein